jgi:DNA-binding winged helix-turn-helix (wHTH) protein
MSLESNRFYVFGAFRLDRVERQLLRNGAAVAIPSKSIDVLLALVEDAGRVIERTELTKRVWPDADEAEGSLAVTISALRKILGDRPDGGPFIETLPRQGYRFAANVTSLPEVNAPNQSLADPEHKPAGAANLGATNSEPARAVKESSDDGLERAQAGDEAATSTAAASGLEIARDRHERFRRDFF